MSQATVEPAANGESARTMRVTSPATGELVREIACTPAAEVRAATLRARKAQAAWAVLPIAERIERVRRLRDALLDREEEIVEAIVREAGKPRHEALAHEVLTTIALADFFFDAAPRALARREVPSRLMKHRRTFVEHPPLGVVGVIAPYNFPFAIPLGTVLAALVAGDAVVVKPSEVAPGPVLVAKAIHDSTGLPEDLFGVVTGRADVGQALIESGIDRMVFTGSVESGRKVAAACGASLVPCTLELGGKAPLVACEDCDVEKTARAIVNGAFVNAGQACVAVERVYAHAAVHEAIVLRAKALTEKLRHGDPSRGTVDQGALALPRSIDHLRRQVDDALAKGARLVTGGRARPGPGLGFEPTILDGCTGAMLVMREESFGPIVGVQRVESDDEAVALANDSPLGLNAYVFTKDRARGRGLAERISAGSVVVNDVLSNYATAEAPFGGVRASGWGRVHGEEGLLAMCATKVVAFDRFSLPGGGFGFPYTEKSYAWLRRGMRALFARRWR